MATTLTDQQIRIMANSLREFAYNVDNAIVREQADKIMAGEQPGGIIGMFVQDWLKKAKLA